MFSELLIKLRKDKGITQKDLADLLHTSDKSISRWEKGSSMPTLEMMYQISKVFSVPFNSLIKARVASSEDDTTYKEIINELSEINNKRLKILKIFLVVAFIVILIMTVTIIFTSSYNRFKVYNVNVENSDFIKTTGFYVETKQKDILNLNNIQIKGVEVTDNDIVSVDIYIMDGEKKVNLNNYTSLEKINFVRYYGSKYNDLSKYADNIYLSVTIVNEEGEITEYKSRLKFSLSFTNNKVIYTDNKIETIQSRAFDFSNERIEKILIENGFDSTNNIFFTKNSSEYDITYYMNFKKVVIKFKQDKLNYSYNYNIENEILNVRIYNDSMTDIQKYTYDINNDKIINCIVGSCNDTLHAMEVINENFLDLFK